MKLLYIPKRNVVPEHAQQFVNGQYVSLDFKISQPEPRFSVTRNVERTLSGRPCITTEREVLALRITAKKLKMKDFALWWEFIRTLQCDSEVLTDPKKVPIYGSVLKTDVANITTVPIYNILNKEYFEVSFDIEWYQLGD